MKLATYQIDQVDRAALVVGDLVFDLVEGQKVVNGLPGPTKQRINRGKPFPETVLGLLQAEPGTLDEARRMDDFLRLYVEHPGDLRLFRRAAHPAASVQWRPPIPHPPMLWCLGGNSPNTIRRHNVPISDWPIGFLKPNTALRGHGEPITVPEFVPSFRWTPELGVVMGRDVRDVSEDDAMQYVLGFTCFNDVTSNYYRSYVQKRADRLSVLDQSFTSHGGKATDGFGPAGPWIVTKDEIPDVYDLMVYGRESGVLRDRGHTASLHVGVERAISFNSRFMTLEAGTIIAMSALRLDDLPIGEVMEPDGYLEVEIERIGVLRNPVIDRRGGT